MHIPLLVFDLVQAFGTAKGFVYLITKALFTRLRFHIVFIETANFSLCFHLASMRKRQKTMIVFIENNNF